MNEFDLAKQRSEAAIEIRARIEHPEVEETQGVLEEVKEKLVQFGR